MSKSSEGRKHSRKHRSMKNLRSSVSSLAADSSPSPGPPIPDQRSTTDTPVKQRHAKKSTSAKNLKDGLTKLPSAAAPGGFNFKLDMSNLRDASDKDGGGETERRKRAGTTPVSLAHLAQSEPYPRADGPSVTFSMPAFSATSTATTLSSSSKQPALSVKKDLSPRAQQVSVLIPVFTVDGHLTNEQVRTKLSQTLGLHGDQRPVPLVSTSPDASLAFIVPGSPLTLQSVQDHLCTIQHLSTELIRARESLLFLMQQHETDQQTISSLTQQPAQPSPVSPTISISTSSLSVEPVPVSSDTNTLEYWKAKYEAEHSCTVQLRSLVNNLEGRLHHLEAVSTPRGSPRPQPDMDSGSRFECRFPGCNCDQFFAKHSAHWVCHRCTHLLVVHDRRA